MGREVEGVLAGFKIQELVVAVAVGLAESSGNTTAINPIPPDLSYGVWQVNMYGDLGPYRRLRYNLSSNAELFNPDVNARVAYGIYDTEGTLGFRHWSVYKSGSYVKFLARANKAVEEIGEDPGFPVDQPDRPSIVDQIIAPIKPIIDFAEFVTKPENWVRVALFASGGVLLAIILWQVTKPPNPLKAAKRVVTSG